MNNQKKYPRMDDQKICFSECPRCGDHGFEFFSTYAHCVSCLYSEDYDVPMIPADMAEIVFGKAGIQLDENDEVTLSMEEEETIA